jgi:hypothetical protein
MTLSPGARLGPYEIVAPLGAGGMGEVYRARDTRLDREVAVKVLHTHLARDPEGQVRFEREARAVASLSHSNIVALFDVGTEGDVTFVVTELLQGRTLRDRLAEGVPARRALEWASQVALGLAAAHERGIVHRDLKPENVFVTDDGRVKILDFGLAQVGGPHEPESQTTMLTQAGTFLGTPGYASPEQVSGEPATSRSDIFALGVILYEMLAGRHPFTRPTVVETLTAVLRDEPPPLAAGAAVPAGIERAIDRCLQKRPADRPASAGDLAFVLDTLGSQHPAPVAEAAPRSEAGVTLPIGATPPRRWPMGPALLVAALAMTWVYVHVAADAVARDAAEAHLERATGLVRAVHEERLARLHLTASLVASLPALRGLLGTDVPTIRDHLLTQQQRLPQTRLLMAFDDRGRLAARSDTEAVTVDHDLLPSLLAQDEPAGVTWVEGRPMHAAVAAGYALDTLVGHIVAASPIDDGFAGLVADAVRDDVVLLSERTVLGSSLRGAQVPWGSLAEWRAAGGSAARAAVTDIGPRQAIAREVPLVAEPAVSAVLVSWRDEGTAPFRRIERGVALIGLVAVAIAGVLAWWGARSRAPRV